MALVAGQLVAPWIATAILRHRLAKDGRVISVHVSAFPWVRLLWQHADKVTVRLADYDAAPGRIDELLRESKGIQTLDVSVGVIHTGPLTLRDVSFDKRGGELVGAARLDLADLRSALPIIRSLTPVHDAGGELVLRGTASVLGVSATAEVAVTARDGKLVVAPTGLFGALATVTVFDDPQIRVQSVSGTTVAGGVRFVARGKLA